MTIDNRRSERVESRLTVRFGRVATDRIAMAENISEGGLYLRTNEVFNQGSQISMSIAFPERNVLLTGEVIWAIRVPEHMVDKMVCGMGVRFVDPPSDWTDFFRKWKRLVTASAD